MFAPKNIGVCSCYCFWWCVVNIMSKKSVLRFTLKELNALILDEKARVVLQRSIRKLPLQPFCLSDLRGSIHEALDANLAKFDRELKGILLSYKNIKIVTDIANVLYDDSRLYLTIQADFYLFRPEVGCVLRGIVNKRSADHIGCLVHKAFNVSIPRPECDTDGDWQGYYVEIGQEVTFRVESLDLTGSLPYMLGHLLDVGSMSGPSSEIFDHQKTTEKEDIVSAISKFNGFLEQHDDPSASVPKTEHKKKKKHKKYEDLESRSNVENPFVKHEKYDSTLENDDRKHPEYGSVLKTPKKKKVKNTDHIAPVKQEDKTHRGNSERGTKYHNHQEEDQLQYEEQILHSKKHIDNSYRLPAFDHLNTTDNLKKKKRKYDEAFYDNENDDENHTFSTPNESIKHKKKKSKKEKHVFEMPKTDEAVEEDFSIDTSQESTSQDKKRKKKKKRDVTEEISADLREDTTSPYINNTPEELITGMHFSQEHFKKLGKKVKPLVTTELVTSTPVEHKTKKENKFSDSVRRSKFSVVSGADSPTDFKQTNFLESLDYFSLMQSPTLKAKHPKEEKESSPAIQSDTVPVKVKKLKKEKRLSSTQQSTVKSISEDHQHSGSPHVLYHSESNLPWSDTENLIRDVTTQPSPSKKLLTNVQETEHKSKIRESVGKHFVKMGLETALESKMKMSKKESRLSIKKRDKIENDVKRIMKTDSNTNSNGDYEDYGNNSYEQIVTQHEELEKGQMSRLVENMTNIKKQSSISRKSFTSPVNAISSLVPSGNTSEENNTSEDDNVFKNIPNLSRTPSSERSPKHNRVIAVNRSSSQTTKSSDRACSSDSGLSLSATSAEKGSNNLTSKDSEREADSTYHAESSRDGRRVKEQAKILPKTPKKKKKSDAEEDSSHLSVKHRIKKEAESPVSRPTRHKTDSVNPLRDDGSLEAERMKILADMIKKLEDGGKEDLPMDNESHKPLSSSPVKARQQSKQEDTMSDSDLDTSKSKKMHKRKESNKPKFLKSSIGEIDNVQQLDTTSYFKPIETHTSSSTVYAGEKELDGNRSCLGEESPVTKQAKISGKTPRRKSTTGTEGSNFKSITKTPVKIKEKESPKKEKVLSSFKTDNKEENFLGEESAGALAERLLENFVKSRSQ